MYMAAGFEGQPSKRSMGSRRRNNVHDVETFGREEFLRRSEASNARHDVAHGGLRGVGGVGYRDQLHPRAAQNRARVVLRMATCADKRNPQGT